LGKREPLWKTIGSTPPEGTAGNASAAFGAAGLLYRVEKAPHTATLADGRTLAHSKVGLYREPTPDDPE
jgi:hypothetical protein